MRRVWLDTLLGAAILLSAIVLTTPVAAQAPEPPGSTLTINGAVVHVRWSDGDSFEILDGEHSGRDVRLGGYNSLESYGPVHRWGEWTSQELYDIAHAAGDFARAGHWVCTASEDTDHYGRLLVTCDGLTIAMVATGLGHLFAVGEPASPDAVAAQSGARELGLGMWIKGVPDSIVTSLHSAAEGGERTYNRLISTTDGASRVVEHEEVYEVCEEVWVEEAGSSLRYVPYDQRYGESRAPCLQSNPEQTEQ